MSAAGRELTIGGQTFKLKFSMKAFEALEQHYGCSSIQEVTERLQDSTKLKARDISVILWAALRSHHPEITAEQCFDMLDGADDFEDVVGIIGKAFASGQPKGAASDPPKAAAQSQ